MRYVFNCFAKDVKELTTVVRSWKDAAGDVQTEVLSLGWYVTLSLGGTDISLSLGEDKPLLAAGDKIKLTLERQL